MLETLRSIFRLDADATWVDILEHSETLARAHNGSTGEKICGIADGPVGSDGETLALAAAEEELRQAEMEWEQLEEKLAVQTAHNMRLRDILQKQQGLLDMTARQMESQHEEIKRQTDRVSELERIEARQQALVRDLESRLSAHQEELSSKEEALAATMAESATHQREVAEQRALTDQLQRELEQERLDAKQEIEQLRSETKRYRDEAREIVNTFTKQEELVDRLKAQLETH